MSPAPAPGPLSQARRDALKKRLDDVAAARVAMDPPPHVYQRLSVKERTRLVHVVHAAHNELMAHAESDLADLLAELARRDALVQAPEVRKLLADVAAEWRQQVADEATDDCAEVDCPDCAETDAKRKAADLLASLLEAR